MTSKGGCGQERLQGQIISGGGLEKEPFLPQPCWSSICPCKAHWSGKLLQTWLPGAVSKASPSNLLLKRFLEEKGAKIPSLPKNTSSAQACVEEAHRPGGTAAPLQSRLRDTGCSGCSRVLGLWMRGLWVLWVLWVLGLWVLQSAGCSRLLEALDNGALDTPGCWGSGCSGYWDFGCWGSGC